MFLQRCQIAFSALTLLVGQQEEHPARKKTEWCGAGMVMVMKRSANDLHMVQLMPLPPLHLCIIKIQNGSSFWYWLTQVVLDKGL